MIGVIIDKFNAIIVDGNIRINEQDTVSFVTENGEVKEGTVSKIGGGKKDRKLQITTPDTDHEELWMLSQIKEGTLKVLKSAIESLADDGEE